MIQGSRSGYVIVLMDPGPGGPTTYGSGSANLTDKELQSKKIRKMTSWGEETYIDLFVPVTEQAQYLYVS